jgi:hypothetical protein
MSKVTRMFVFLILSCGALGYYLYTEVAEKIERARVEQETGRSKSKKLIERLQRSNDSLRNTIDSLNNTDSIQRDVP